PPALELSTGARLIRRAAVLAPAGPVEAVGCWLLTRLDDLAIELHQESLAGPIGTAQRQREFPRRAESQCQLRGLPLWEVRFHRQLDAGLGPRRAGRHVQVHPEPIVPLVVNPVAVQGVAF